MTGLSFRVAHHGINCPVVTGAHKVEVKATKGTGEVGVGIYSK